MSRTRLSLRIDLANGSRVGPGKVALLEAVRTYASISAAARAEGMSYRRAWLLIDDMNRAFKTAVVETFPGRSQGSGARLTEFGEHLITLYKDAETRARSAIAKQIAAIEGESTKSYENPRVSTHRRRGSNDAEDA